MKHFSDNLPITYLITSGELCTENFQNKSKEILRIIEVAVDAGISIIQIREKKLPARLIFQLTSEAVNITEQSKTKLLVNDRADIALAANTDGVHLTSHSIPTEIIRKNFPEEFIIGVSTHSLEMAQMVKSKGADFATFSSIFFSPNKGEPQGVNNLREVCEKLSPFPIIALGGIDETNYSDVLDCGASGFAAIRFLNNETNLRDWKQRFENKE